MYGPGGGDGGRGGGGRFGGGGRGGGPGGMRLMTPKGQMSGSNLLPAITGLPQRKSIHFYSNGSKGAERNIVLSWHNRSLSYTSDIKIMFEPRPPVVHAKPIKKPKPMAYTGISQYVGLFEKEEPAKREPFVTHRERKVRQGSSSGRRAFVSPYSLRSL